MIESAKEIPGLDILLKLTTVVQAGVPLSTAQLELLQQLYKEISDNGIGQIWWFDQHPSLKAPASLLPGGQTVVMTAGWAISNVLGNAERTSLPVLGQEEISDNPIVSSFLDMMQDGRVRVWWVVGDETLLQTNYDIVEISPGDALFPYEKTPASNRKTIDPWTLRLDEFEQKNNNRVMSVEFSLQIVWEEESRTIKIDIAMSQGQRTQFNEELAKWPMFLHQLLIKTFDIYWGPMVSRDALSAALINLTSIVSTLGHCIRRSDSANWRGNAIKDEQSALEFANQEQIIRSMLDSIKNWEIRVAGCRVQDRAISSSTQMEDILVVPHDINEHLSITRKWSVRDPDYFMNDHFRSKEILIQRMEGQQDWRDLYIVLFKIHDWKVSTWIKISITCAAELKDQIQQGLFTQRSDGSYGLYSLLNEIFELYRVTWIDSDYLRKGLHPIGYFKVM